MWHKASGLGNAAFLLLVLSTILVTCKLTHYVVCGSLTC